MSKLDVVESPLEQSADEEVAYQITTTNTATNPTSPSVAVIDENTGVDVTSTVFTSPTVGAPVGDLITLPKLKSLVEGHRYRVEVLYTSGGNKRECRFLVDCVF